MPQAVISSDSTSNRCRVQSPDKEFKSYLEHTLSKIEGLGYGDTVNDVLGQMLERGLRIISVATTPSTPSIGYGLNIVIIVEKN